METKPLFRIDHYTEKKRPARYRLRKTLDSYKEAIPASISESRFIDTDEFDFSNVESPLIEDFQPNEPNADLQSSSRSQVPLNAAKMRQSKK